MSDAREPIFQFFKYDHLPEKLQVVSKPFGELAQRIEETLPRNAERSVALRKLLESKDAAVRALIAVAALVLLLPSLAFAQVGPVSDPPWVKLLLGALPFLIPAVLSIHPLLMLSKWLTAKANGEGVSTLAKTALVGTSSVATSLDHFLEATQMDAKDLIDPTKRALAVKHIEDEAKNESLPALSAAADAMGQNWVTGQASQVIDAAIHAAPAAAEKVMAAFNAPATPAAGSVPPAPPAVATVP